MFSGSGPAPNQVVSVSNRCLHRDSSGAVGGCWELKRKRRATQFMATHTAGLHSRGESLRTWCGVLFALFAFLFIRLIFGGFSAHQSIAQAVAREGAIWAAAAALVLFILRVEKLPLTSVGIGGSPWRKSLLWGSVLSGICGAGAVAIIAATKYHGGPGSAAIERFSLWLVTFDRDSRRLCRRTVLPWLCHRAPSDARNATADFGGDPASNLLADAPQRRSGGSVTSFCPGRNPNRFLSMAP